MQDISEHKDHQCSIYLYIKSSMQDISEHKDQTDHQCRIYLSEHKDQSDR